MLAKTEANLAKKAAIVVSVSVVIVGSIALFYTAAPAFMLIFGGLLLAAIFRALAIPLEKLGLPHRIAWPIVVLLFFGLIAAGLYWGGATLIQQYNELWEELTKTLDDLQSMLSEIGINIAVGDDGSGGLRSYVPNPSSLFSSASNAIFSVLGVLGNLFVVIFIALFIIAQPGLYRRGLVSLFPQSKRQRMDKVLRAAAWELVLWLCGTGISMLTVFVVTWAVLALIGMPNAFLLALQAGLLAFIPTLGPFIAGIPIVLTGITVSFEMALWGLGAYALVQTVESNLSQPVAQRMTSALPPALTLGSQVVFGVLFGTLGLALAVPFVAVLMTFVLELYVKDTLGGSYQDGASDEG